MSIFNTPYNPEIQYVPEFTRKAWDDMYKQLAKHPFFVLIHGASSTGKTSSIQGSFKDQTGVMYIPFRQGQTAKNVEGILKTAFGYSKQNTNSQGIKFQIQKIFNF